MAVVSTKSTQITNRDATPKVISNSFLTKASLSQASGVVAAVSGDSIASKYFFTSVPSSAKMSSLMLSHPDIGTTGAMDVGLYQTTEAGGAVVDADFFKAAHSLSGGALTKSEVLFGNVITVANAEKRLWEHLSLTSDPGVMYDIVGTLTAAQDASGAILAEAVYME